MTLLLKCISLLVVNLVPIKLFWSLYIFHTYLKPYHSLILSDLRSLGSLGQYLAGRPQEKNRVLQEIILVPLSHSLVKGLATKRLSKKIASWSVCFFYLFKCSSIKVPVKGGYCWNIPCHLQIQWKTCVEMLKLLYLKHISAEPLGSFVKCLCRTGE